MPHQDLDVGRHGGFVWKGSRVFKTIIPFRGPPTSKLQTPMCLVSMSKMCETRAELPMRMSYHSSCQVGIGGWNQVVIICLVAESFLPVDGFLLYWWNTRQIWIQTWTFTWNQIQSLVMIS